eukprot:1339001-Pleurochrysis_carterae.AAC.1
MGSSRKQRAPRPYLPNEELVVQTRSSLRNICTRSSSCARGAPRAFEALGRNIITFFPAVHAYKRASWYFRRPHRRFVRNVAAFCFLATCCAAASKFAEHLLAYQLTGLHLSLGQKRYVEP